MKWNVTFLHKIRKIYSFYLISVVHLDYFVVFGGSGGFRCLSPLFLDELKAGHCCFERPGPRGRFLAEIRICWSIFPSNAKKDSPLVPFFGRLGKIFKLSVPILTIFVSLLELSTFRRTLWPSTRLRHSLKINISDRYCVTNATYHLKNIALSPRPHGSMSCKARERRLCLIEEYLLRSLFTFFLINRQLCAETRIDCKQF